MPVVTGLPTEGDHLKIFLLGCFCCQIHPAQHLF